MTSPSNNQQSHNSSFTIAVYLVITGLSAACGLVIEIVAGRMIAPYLGMSLYTWTAIIAVVLAGFTAGHWVGGILAEKPSGQARRAVALSLFLAGIFAALSLILLRTMSGPIIQLGLSPVPTILILTTVLFFPPSFFVGIPSPALTKLAIDEAPGRMGSLLGAFYAIGALGSIIGTLAAGYLFISYFGSIRTILTVSGLYIVMALILFLQDRWLDGKPLSARTTALPVGIGAILLSGTLLWGTGVKAFVEHCTKESAYYCIRVIDITRDVGTPARSMVLDNLGHGANLKDRPDTFLTPYVEAQDALVRSHFKDRSGLHAFFIGGGAYTLPRGWLARWPDAKVSVAEIDPDVTMLAHKAFWLPAGPRLTVIHQDARRALTQQPENGFDIIVGDAFHDIAVPQHLVTQEFFALIASRLNNNGTYLMNVVDNGTRPRLALSIRKTLKTAFPIVELWRPLGQGERQTFVIIASQNATARDTVQSRIDPQSSWHRIDAGELRRLEIKTSPLTLTDDFAPVDRLIGVE
ncbi:MAG: fused MFS/spermidine synthase [Alphaproteobacteria bacterium]|nr:fused MFS/spermidine synthase [Alphaproteobacteria bacterium]